MNHLTKTFRHLPTALAAAMAALTPIACSGLPGNQVGSTGASALTGGTIDPDDVMRDADLTGAQNVTADQVKAFLAHHGSALATYTDPSSGKTAPTLIVELSEAQKISPVYMLARLESEQTLVTSGTTTGLDDATGCACFDGEVCNPAFSGFYQQLQCSAMTIRGDLDRLNHGEATSNNWNVNQKSETSDPCEITPVNAATAALYSYDPWVGAYSTGSCGASEWGGVTGLATIFRQYALSFAGSSGEGSTGGGSSSGGSTSGGSSGGGSSACPGSAMRSKIQALAVANVGKTACGENSNGKGTSGFETSCCGNNGYPQYWCSDFANWVWQQAGVSDTSTLNDGAVSFQEYGHAHGTLSTQPEVGDAVVFGFECDWVASAADSCKPGQTPSANHVAIVSKVYPDGTIESVSGDFGQADPTTPTSCPGYSGGPSDPSQASFAASSTVVLNEAYSAKPGTTGIGQVLNFFVSPVGAGSCSAPAKPKPTPPKTPPSPEPPSSAAVVAMTPTPTGTGYWITRSDGTVAAFGSAKTYGAGTPSLTSAVVGIASTTDGGGYWLATADGGVVTFGDAPFKGSMSGQHLNAAIVGIAADPGGGGYWLAGADGGVFAFGAVFEGSTGAHPPTSPVIGIAAPDSGGYWLATANGEIFSFGDAIFEGAHPQKSTSPAIVSIAATPDNAGYWLLSTEGAVFDFGTAFADGSRKGTTSTYVAVVANPGWQAGYWVLASDGAVYSFGGAPYFGGAS